MTADAETAEKANAEAEVEAASATRGGRFFAFEGIDGSGKSTLARNVFERLSLGMAGKVVLTAEPTKTWLGDCVRQAFVDRVSPFSEALLFVADRAEHTLQIRKWMDDGKVVLCDRYYASTIAYQGALIKETMGQKKAIEWLKQINEPVIIRPDVTFILTIKAETALARLKGRPEVTKFENLEYLRDVDLMYRHLAMEDPTAYTVNASKDPMEVAEEVLNYIRGRI
jgi:dTMP kinase